jgi:hypothetical protein
MHGHQVTATTIWELQAVDGGLAFVASHGTFPVAGMEGEVAALAAQLPRGTEVKCACTGRNVRELQVLRIEAIRTNLSSRASELPDQIVALDRRLLQARARARIDARLLDLAAGDLIAAMRLEAPAVLDVLEELEIGALSPAARASLVAEIARWTQSQPTTWRMLRLLPLARWSKGHLEEALRGALANRGTFGSAPGVEAEALVAELARRGAKRRPLETRVAAMRKRAASGADISRRVPIEPASAKVIGASERGVYVTAGSTLSLRAFDGQVLETWNGLVCDRVIDGMALLIDRPSGCATPAGAVRLSDGARRIDLRVIHRHDAELLHGTGHDVVDEIWTVTGRRILELGTGYSEVWWDRDTIWVRTQGLTKTYDRAGTLLATGDAEPPKTIDVQLAIHAVTLDAIDAPWNLRSWPSLDGAGWRLRWSGRQLALAESAPGSVWTLLDLSAEPSAIELAPPWLVLRDGSLPALLVPLEALARERVIEVEGKPFARRAALDISPVLPPAIARWAAALSELGIVPRVDAATVRHLLEVFGEDTTVGRGSLQRALPRWSPWCYTGDGHALSAREIEVTFSDMFREDGIRVSASDAPPTGSDYPRMALRIGRGERVVEEACAAELLTLVSVIDPIAASLGSTRRVFLLTAEDDEHHVAVVATPTQYAALRKLRGTR